LADEEATAVLNGVPNSRGELESKSVEKDVKTINSLIVKGSKWIKIHMIYKKLSQAGGAGEGFIVSSGSRAAQQQEQRWPALVRRDQEGTPRLLPRTSERASTREY